ncbi:hypothetical protein ACQEXU_10450 [Vibrio sp. TRT 21S02]|uniref:hypothetical protein n=1 Tax=Vibrio sp. TRT 21S02 TaxID=3418507 RepID=UPI003CF8313B
MRKIKSTDKIAILSLFTSLVRVLGGPITIILVSSMLTLEKMGFYYTFFSIIAMAQLFEVGVGFVLKQYYSHDCVYESNGSLTDKSITKSSHLFRFSIQWYLTLTVIYIAVLLPFGSYYFRDYSGNVEWQFPYVLLVIATGLNIFLNVVVSYLDGMQHQILLNKARLISSLSMSVSLWILIASGFDLYSLGISQGISVIVFLTVSYVKKSNYIHNISLNLQGYSFKAQFKKVFPLLGKTGIVWFFGYFFWNGFTLLSFKLYGAEIAGKIGLSLALAKGGYDIANSFIANQRTVMANLIANNKESESLSTFYRYFIISTVVLILGYSAYFVFRTIFPDFYIFEKVISNSEMLYLFIFYCLTLGMTSMNNYVRSYKIEPFLTLSLYNSIFVPGGFYIASKLGSVSIFLAPVLVMILPLSFSIYIFIRKVRCSRAVYE